MIFHPFIESRSSLLCLQAPDMGLCPQPEDASPKFCTLVLLSSLFLLDLPTKTVYVCYIPHQPIRFSGCTGSQVVQRRHCKSRGLYVL